MAFARQVCGHACLRQKRSIEQSTYTLKRTGPVSQRSFTLYASTQRSTNLIVAGSGPYDAGGKSHLRGHVRGGKRAADHGLQSEPRQDIVFKADEASGSLKDVRLVLPDPCNLRQRVHGMAGKTSPTIDGGFAKSGSKFRHLRACARINIEKNSSNRYTLFVERNKALAMTGNCGSL